MFNSINGDRRYKAEDFAQYFATFIGNGIFVKPSDCLQIRANGDSMSVIVRPGKAWVNGFYLINDEDYNLPLAVGDATLNRIDRIVIRLDFIQRKMSVEVKKGTLSASPIAPTLKRDADAYELALADVYVAKGALTVNQAAITDTRLNNNLCGLMHGVVDQVDTTTIFNQYQQWFNDYSVTKASEFLAWQTNVTTALENWIDAQEKGFEAWRQAEEQLYYTWLNGKKNDFDTWFATIKDILDTNAAGNLQNQIDDHKDAAMPHVYLDTGDNENYLWGLKRNPDLDTPAFVYAGITNPLKKGDINLSSYEQVADVLEMLGRVDQGTGYISDLNGKRYAAKMLRGYVFDGLLLDIIYNKPPTSSGVLWKYDSDAQAIFWCNGTTMGKLTIDPVTRKVITFQTIDATDNVGFTNASKSYLDGKIQFDADNVYFLRNVNFSPTTVANTHRDIIKVNKFAFQTYTKIRLTEYIEPTIPYFYSISSFLITEKHIIISVEGNINNGGAYSANIFVFDKETGNGIQKLLTLTPWGAQNNVCIGPYRIDDNMYFMIGDGANIRIVKFAYNPVTGLLTYISYTASTMPIGPNNINYWYMFNEGNLLYIGDKMTVVDVSTLTVTIPTIASSIVPICKIGNEIYLHNNTTLQTLDLTTKAFTSIATLGSAIQFRIGGWKTFFQTEPFDINEWLYLVAGKGPLFIENKYDLLYYQGVGE